MHCCSALECKLHVHVDKCTLYMYSVDKSPKSTLFRVEGCLVDSLSLSCLVCGMEYQDTCT